MQKLPVVHTEPFKVLVFVLTQTMYSPRTSLNLYSLIFAGVSSIMLIRPEEKALIAQVFKTYLAEHHHEDILQLIAKTTEEAHHPVLVNAMTLFEASMEVMPALI